MRVAKAVFKWCLFVREQKNMLSFVCMQIPRNTFIFCCFLSFFLLGCVLQMCLVAAGGQLCVIWEEGKEFGL